MSLLNKAFIVAASLGTAFASPRAGGDDAVLEPGMWRLTLTSTTNGNPDPVQDFRQCLGEELKDLPAYFAPQLENPDNVELKCSRAQQPPTERELTYRMQCSGAGLTVDALTSVTIQDSHHFTVTLQINSRTEQESALVVGEGEGRWTGACPGK
ncbi:MAG: DUF3617 domain-containing protein [Gammaproteobacteria bacterium]